MASVKLVTTGMTGLTGGTPGESVGAVAQPFLIVKHALTPPSAQSVRRHTF